MSSTSTFDIFSPTGGLREDIPAVTLPESFTDDNRNVLLRNGTVSRVKRPYKELTDGSDGASAGALRATPDGFDILKYHWFEKLSNQTKYLYAFTKAHIYQWDTVTKNWLDRTPAIGISAAAVHWSVVTYNDRVVATNGIDKILECTGSVLFAVMGSAGGLQYVSGKYITACKHVLNFQNYLMLAGVTADSVFYPSDMYHNAIGDAADWMGEGAGSWTVEGDDAITGLGTFSGFMIIFKERSIYRFWPIANSDLFFNGDNMSRTVGCNAPDSIVAGESGELYFFAHDYSVRAIVGLTSEFPIMSDGIVKTCESVPPALIPGIRAKYTKRYRQLIFALPVGGDATANNTVMIIADGAWTRHDLAVTAFGEYERLHSTWTIDTIPFDTIDSIGWESFDSLDQISGYRTDLVGVAGGYTYAPFASEMDTDGTAYTGYFVLGTDFSIDKRKHKAGQLNNYFKRLLGLRVYFNGPRPGIVSLYIQRDFNGSYEDAGTIDMSTKQGEINYWDVPVDFRAKHFRLKVSCSDPFEFVGVTFKYIQLGEL